MYSGVSSKLWRQPITNVTGWVYKTLGGSDTADNRLLVHELPHTDADFLYRNRVTER